MLCEVRARLQFNDVQVETGEGGQFGDVQFNDVPVGGWCKERVGASDDEKKFLVGMVTADRNTMPSSGCCFHATSGFVHDFM
jgi:hypothetical protein